MRSVIYFCISVIALAFLAYGLMHFFELDTGRMMDWVVGLGAFLWIMVIVTVPWNAHFRAREVLDDASISQRKGIMVIDETLAFAQRVARRSLWMAIGLHIFSAIVLYMIASLEISPVGYLAAAFAALLTFFRPSVRFYEYLTTRLSAIKEEFRYPREDLIELLEKVSRLENMLDTDPDVESWHNEINQLLKERNERFEVFREDAHRYLEKNDAQWVENNQYLQAKFALVRQESAERMAKITADSQILDSVRELAGFVRQLK